MVQNYPKNFHPPPYLKKSEFSNNAFNRRFEAGKGSKNGFCCFWLFLAIFRCSFQRQLGTFKQNEAYQDMQENLLSSLSIVSRLYDVQLRRYGPFLILDQFWVVSKRVCGLGKKIPTQLSQCAICRRISSTKCAHSRASYSLLRGVMSNFLIFQPQNRLISEENQEIRLYHIPSGTSQTSLMPPIDRSRRDLSIGGIRLVWEGHLHQ